MKLWPILLVVVALGTVVSCAMVARIDDGVAVDTPAHLNPSPADGDPRALAFVAPLEALRPTTTTTTAPQHNLSRKQRSALYEAATGAVNGYPCGSDLPPCRVLRCESGGDPTAENPTSSASGLWQITDGTWAGFQGYARAIHAPVEVQNEKARQLWAGGRGAFHWKSCL